MFSVLASSVFAVGSLIWGFFAGSQMIIFDGLYSFVSVALSLLAVWALRAARSGPDERYPWGREIFEPLTIAVKAVALAGLCLYALVGGVGDLLSGGREIDAGWAVDLRDRGHRRRHRGVARAAPDEPRRHRPGAGRGRRVDGRRPAVHRHPRGLRHSAGPAAHRQRRARPLRRPGDGRPHLGDLPEDPGAAGLRGPARGAHDERRARRARPGDRGRRRRRAGVGARRAGGAAVQGRLPAGRRGRLPGGERGRPRAPSRSSTGVRAELDERLRATGLEPWMSVEFTADPRWM